MPDRKKMKSLLQRRRTQLLTRMHEASSALGQPHSKDWDDQAIEREQDEVLTKLSLDDRNELKGIEAALARIADNSYGTCVDCGGQITAARLMVLPATPVCRTCAATRSGAANIRASA